MKFLCRNCKAKYQIADDKVVGRTLRMTCQQCGEPIVVRSGSATSRSSSQVSRPLTPMTLAGTGPLGADFQRQISAAPRDVPAQPEDWHVAINDVPVGPMRREEVARKIALNAVDRDSLAWREGMDDWQPIKHIPELAALFPAAPPVAAGVTITGVPPAPAMPVAPPPAAMPIAPSARVDMAPVGGRQMLSVDEYSVPLGEPAVAIQQLPSETPAAAGGKQLGWGPMFALVSGGAFILAAGAFLGVRVLAPQPASAPTAVVAPPPTAASKPAETANNGNDRQNNVIELDVQRMDGQQNPTGPRRPTNPTAAAPKKELTAEQKEMLARMGSPDPGGPKLNLPTDTPTRTNAGGALTAEQLSAVVLRGRKNLQRCYETALRGSGSSETVRLDVEIEVSPNGNVTLVKASGKGLPGMDDCITRTVKMWRFPNSGEVTQTRFPVVFQPGA
ncbi:MAG TPA: GYF domain-containing protein [Polyangiales bacterium]|nr:GYF domain-containing protein [Polyangiales bacterium]